MAPGEAKALISEALEGSSTRMTRKPTGENLKTGSPKPSNVSFYFETPRTLRGHPPGPRTPSRMPWQPEVYYCFSGRGHPRTKHILQAALCGHPARGHARTLRGHMLSAPI